MALAFVPMNDVIGAFEQLQVIYNYYIAA